MARARSMLPSSILRGVIHLTEGGRARCRRFPSAFGAFLCDARPCARYSWMFPLRAPVRLSRCAQRHAHVPRHQSEHVRECSSWLRSSSARANPGNRQRLAGRALRKKCFSWLVSMRWVGAIRSNGRSSAVAEPTSESAGGASLRVQGNVFNKPAAARWGVCKRRLNIGAELQQASRRKHKKAVPNMSSLAGVALRIQ